MRSLQSKRSLILFALFTMLLAPLSSALAFDGGERRRLDRVSRQAHADHARLIAKAARPRERIIAQARAIRDKTMAESHAAPAGA